MREWHQPPEYFLENWTDEEYWRFWDARNENIMALNQAVSQDQGMPSVGPGYVPPQPAKQVSDTEMFAKFGIGSA